MDLNEQEMQFFHASFVHVTNLFARDSRATPS